VARKHEHEEHANHEAWAIPYGDLVTLLLAFFVVMYAVSSVNEGKYRVLSDSMVAAFRGQPTTMEPVQVGDKLVKVKQDDTLAGIKPGEVTKFDKDEGASDNPTLQNHLQQMSDDLELAMQELIDQEMIRVERAPSWVEVEIKADILFPSGSAAIEPGAVEVLERVAAILAVRPYPIRIEGHTDTRPIRTAQFPSNWELSAARAARIVRLFEERGIAPSRMVVAGMGENEPVADNTTDEGRNRNRRVTIVILGRPPADSDPKPGAAEAVAAGPEVPGTPVQVPPVTLASPEVSPPANPQVPEVTG
jgi:chemotaxis protein MotB